MGIFNLFLRDFILGFTLSITEKFCANISLVFPDPHPDRARGRHAWVPQRIDFDVNDPSLPPSHTSAHSQSKGAALPSFLPRDPSDIDIFMERR